jgi:hypothetical protein
MAQGDIEVVFSSFHAGSKTELARYEQADIEVVFSSFHAGLSKLIKQEFAGFLLRANFGARQNKGYGSFYLANESDPDWTSHLKVPYLIIPKQGNNICLNHDKDWPHVMNIIAYYYQRLRSGINYTKEKEKGDAYQHSFLKLYLKKAGFTWEKRWLKETFKANFNGGFEAKNTEVEERFARALLGFPITYNFMPLYKDKNKPEKDFSRAGKFYPQQRFGIETKAVDDNINRMKSPITFKPILLGQRWCVFINVTQPPDEILNKSFSFTESLNKATYELATPKSSIDMADLITEYHKHLKEDKIRMSDKSLEADFIAITYNRTENYQVRIGK